jgi:hypothetical protein
MYASALSPRLFMRSILIFQSSPSTFVIEPQPVACDVAQHLISAAGFREWNGILTIQNSRGNCSLDFFPSVTLTPQGGLSQHVHVC